MLSSFRCSSLEGSGSCLTVSWVFSDLSSSKASNQTLKTSIVWEAQMVLEYRLNVEQILVGAVQAHLEALVCGMD